MPTLADADGCCRVCESMGGCAFAFTCPCHKDRGVLETSLRDLNQAAREVPYWEFADRDPDGGSL